MTPKTVVEAIYAAFQRGDIAAILEHLDDDVRWESWTNNSAQKADVPWLRPQRGKAGAAEFFKVIGQFKFQDFSVLTLMTGESQVAAEFTVDCTLPNGARLNDEEIHLFTFGPNGKVIRFRHYCDTAKHIAAAKG